LGDVADLAAVVAVVTAGRNNMPPFTSLLTAAQIRDVAAYVTATLAAGAAD
jgi:mono/diheme cytochrome c family protein